MTGKINTHDADPEDFLKYCQFKLEPNPMMHFWVSAPRDVQWLFGILRLGPRGGC